MKFHKKLYLSDAIKKPVFQVKHSIVRHPMRKNYYIICLAKSADQFEIFSSRYLVQTYYKKNPPYVIGIGKNRDDAIALMQIIIKDIFTETGSTNFKEYFL